MTALEAYTNITRYPAKNEIEYWRNRFKNYFSINCPRHLQLAVMESELFHIEWITFQSKSRLHANYDALEHLINEFIIIQVDLEDFEFENYHRLRERAKIGEINIQDEYGIFLLTTDPEINFKLQLMTGYQNDITR